MRQASDEPSSDGIGHLSKYDGYGAGCPLYFRQGGTRRGKNDVRVQSHQFERIGSHFLGVIAGPTIADFKIAAFDPSVFQQTKFESCNASLSFRIGFVGTGRHYAEPVHRLPLLRPDPS